MRGIRVRLAGVATLLLLVQAAALAVWPVAACCDVRPAMESMDCCRGGDNGHICALKTKGAAKCRMRAGCESQSMGLAAATAWLGIVVERVEIARVDTVSPLLPDTSVAVFPWLQPPPTPPPRG